MRIQESAENYLETILMLEEAQGTVKSIDIVNKLNFSKPSVSIAMKNLREAGYINMDGNGYITLLPPGKAIAKKIYRRHKLMTNWLIKLGVEPETAAEDACKIEHVLSEESFNAIERHMSIAKESN